MLKNKKQIKDNKLGIISLVVGIISVLFTLISFMPQLLRGKLDLYRFYIKHYEVLLREATSFDYNSLSILLGVIAAILAAIQLKRNKNKIAIAGLIFGIIPIVLHILFFTLAFLYFFYLILTVPGGSW